MEDAYIYLTSIIVGSFVKPILLHSIWLGSEEENLMNLCHAKNTHGKFYIIFQLVVGVKDGVIKVAGSISKN